MTQTLGIIGLGSMGYGMAQSLLRAGHKVHGFDINPDQVARFVAEGGASGDLVDVADGLDALVVVVLNAQQTEAVLLGETGAAPLMKKDSVVIA